MANTKLNAHVISINWYQTVQVESTKYINKWPKINKKQVFISSQKHLFVNYWERKHALNLPVRQQVKMRVMKLVICALLKFEVDVNRMTSLFADHSNDILDRSWNRARCDTTADSVAWQRHYKLHNSWQETCSIFRTVGLLNFVEYRNFGALFGMFLLWNYDVIS